jgi:hypothetical protein
MMPKAKNDVLRVSLETGSKLVVLLTSLVETPSDYKPLHERVFS